MCPDEPRPVAQFMFPAKHGCAEEYAHHIVHALPPELQRLEVRIGLVEALTNAILHGAFRIQVNTDDLDMYLDAIEEAERTSAGKALIGVTVCMGDGTADILVDDFGAGFDWQQARVRCGRGLGILHEVFDAVTWNPGGNCVRLTIGGKGGGRG